MRHNPDRTFNMAASSSDSGELSQLLATLVSEFPGIVTDATRLDAAKGRPGVIARLACEHNHAGCQSEQVQIAPSKGRRTEVQCVLDLKALLLKKHARCITEAEAELEAERAEATRQAELLSFGTMMAAQENKQADEQCAAAVKLAKEQIQQIKQRASKVHVERANPAESR